jgi:hypothetical protein
LSETSTASTAAAPTGTANRFSHGAARSTSGSASENHSSQRSDHSTPFSVPSDPTWSGRMSAVSRATPSAPTARA